MVDGRPTDFKVRMREVSKLRMTGFYTQRMMQIVSQGLTGKLPKIPIRLDLLEEVARHHIAKGPLSYILPGSGREDIAHKNHDAFLKWSILPEVLTDVSTLDTTLELFGQTHAYPFILSPVGGLDLAHPDAEAAAAKAAASEDIAMGFSSMASTPMEKVAGVMDDCKRWYQLYWTNKKEYNESLIRRAEACGCSALLITVDTKTLGWRTESMEIGYSPSQDYSSIAQYTSDPVFNRLVDEQERAGIPVVIPKLTPTLIKNFIRMSWLAPGSFWKNLWTYRAIRMLRMVSEILAHYSLTWEDIVALRKITKLPILVKGILSPEDAKKAVAYGIDGIIVSNHGGRQLSSSITAIDALPPIVEAVQGKIPVLMDSGIRGGADVFKALALGAKAVLVGRPYVYALAIAGEDGVREMIQNLKAEFDTTMILAGCTKLTEVTRDKVVRNES